MNKITHSIIETLSAPQQGSVISLYCPTHRASTPQNIKSDTVRLENLFSEAVKQWQEKTDTDSFPMTDDVTKLLHSTAFWEEMTEGLALFINDTSVDVVHLPVECEESVCVDSSFDVTPLKMMQQMDQPYYVLALAMHDPKLFCGDIYGLTPVDLELPHSPEDALNIDEMFSGSNTVRGVSTQGGGNDMLSSHGQGDSNHAGQEERLKYFRIIDNLLLTSDKIDSSLPFVIAATESEAADFKGCSKLPHLVEQSIPGNHTMSKLTDLHTAAWSIIVDSIHVPRTTALLESFHEQKGLQKASSDVASIHEALATSRVETLMVGVAEMTNDSVVDSDQPRTAPLLRIQTMLSDGSMRKLIQATYAQGGTVFAVDPDKLATPSNVAAVYRY